MNVRITMSVAGRAVDEVLSGPDADDVLAQAKQAAQVQNRQRFAQKSVELYNGAHKTAYAAPQSADEFFRLGKDLGYITILPD